MRSDEDRVWERGWAAHETAQRRRLARLPLDQKLRWLEEAQAIVGYLRQPSRTAHQGADKRVEAVSRQHDA